MFEKTKTVKAKIPHTCIWCGEEIKKGEIYVSESFFKEKRFVIRKFHFHCFTVVPTSEWWEPQIHNRAEPFVYFEMERIDWYAILFKKYYCNPSISGLLARKNNLSVIAGHKCSTSTCNGMVLSHDNEYNSRTASIQVFVEEEWRDNYFEAMQEMLAEINRKLYYGGQL